MHLYTCQYYILFIHFIISHHFISILIYLSTSVFLRFSFLLYKFQLYRQMRVREAINKVKSLTFLVNKSIFTSTKQQSYYEILGVSNKASTKQIRTQFLKKARKLHPDHNDAPEAQQEFKKLKKAYEVLKDPQTRYVYDSGISTDEVNENVYQGANAKDSGPKYYQNKWYGYQKAKFEDIRDEYYEKKFMFEDEDAYQKKFWYRGIGIALVIGGFFAYDFLQNKNSRADAERQHIKELLQGTSQDKKTRKLRRYIQERAKVHKVQ